MRIISGTAKGRRLFAPPKLKGREIIRPTSDKVREAIFNILGNRVKGSNVLDLYSGTGALAIEAISRGSAKAVLVDRSKKSIDLIKKNVTICGFSEDVVIIRHDLSKSLIFLREHTPKDGFDLVFVDPPYRQGKGGEILRMLSEGSFVSKNGIVVLEEAKGHDVDALETNFSPYDVRVYGDTEVRLYSGELLRKK